MNANAPLSVSPISASRDAQVFRERLSGSSLSEVGRRHDLTLEGVRVVFAREARKHVNQVHLDLITSHATGDVPAVVVPETAGAGLHLAFSYLEWALGELKARGMRVGVAYKSTYTGLVAFLHDLDPPAGSKAASPRRSNQ